MWLMEIEEGDPAEEALPLAVAEVAASEKALALILIKKCYGADFGGLATWIIARAGSQRIED